MKIIKIEEIQIKITDDYDFYDSIKITFDDNSSVAIGISGYQQCCENFYISKSRKLY